MKNLHKQKKEAIASLQSVGFDLSLSTHTF